MFKNKKLIILISVTAVILTSIFVILLTSLNSKIKKAVVIEAGDDVPNVEDFFINSEIGGIFITDISAVDTKKIGSVKIEIELDNKKYSSILIIQDTIPPTAEPVTQYIFKGANLSDFKADDFVKNINDVTNVICAFKTLPDALKEGLQSFTITMTDEGLNRAEIDTECYVLNYSEKLTLEAGEFKTILPQDFIKNYTDDLPIDISESDKINFRVPGVYPVILKLGKYEVESSVEIVDTIPPTAKPVTQYIFKNSTDFEASDFVTDIQDATTVVCAFKTLVDERKEGRQYITITLTDEGLNRAEIDAECYVLNYAEKLTLEAGTVNAISIKDFIINYDDIDLELSLLLLEQKDKIKFSKPGEYAVILKLGKYEVESSVEIVDTIPPTAKPVTQYIFKNSTDFEASDFVTDIQDATTVVCAFKTLVDERKEGRQYITITLTDEGLNRAEIDTECYVLDYADELVIEAGTVNAITAKKFILNSAELTADLSDLSAIPQSKINFNVPGIYPVTLKSGKYTAESAVKIVDTTPPVGNVKNRWTYKNKQIPAADFVYNIKDVSPVTVKYKTNPDFSVEGVHNIIIILEDAYKNTSEYKAFLTVVVDVTPPVISGDLNKWVIVGGTISYRSGITVTDDYDTNPVLTINSSGVNLNQAGTYTVIYSASDISGNKSESTGIITVRSIDMALVNEMADNILAKIINGGMTQYDKAKAIYNWVNAKMSYSAVKSAREISRRAYDCFTKGSGDCYTYMAASNVLLTRAGIKNLIVQRTGFSAAHYWNLVDVGTGWHHFDTCPTPGNAVGKGERFLFTETQAEAFTQRIKTSYLYYNYDKSAVPAVVE